MTSSTETTGFSRWRRSGGPLRYQKKRCVGRVVSHFAVSKAAIFVFWSVLESLLTFYLTRCHSAEFMLVFIIYAETTINYHGHVDVVGVELHVDLLVKQGLGVGVEVQSDASSHCCSMGFDEFRWMLIKKKRFCWVGGGSLCSDTHW